MTAFATWLSSHLPLTIGVGILALLLLASIRYIPNTRVGIVEKRLSRRGSVTSGVIALQGQAGFQPDVLRGGFHFLLRGVYAVHSLPLVTIPQGRIGYVFARDGAPLPSSQALARGASSHVFDDVRGFLGQGGQRGPQRAILREGTYALNLAMFAVITAERVIPAARSRRRADLPRHARAAGRA